MWSEENRWVLICRKSVVASRAMVAEVRLWHKESLLGKRGNGKYHGGDDETDLTITEGLSCARLCCTGYDFI